MNALHRIISANETLKKIDKPVRVIGIDLGTTNSTVAEITYDPANTIQGAEVRCLAVEQPTDGRGWWNPLVPSILALHDGREIVGEGARRLRTRGRKEGLIDKSNLFAACKNDMGLRRTYHMAPTGYRSAAEISGRIIDFLVQAAMKDKPLAPVRATVTVPASFQAAQRDDTLLAAKLAKLTLQGGDLLDEPVAAFIGYLAEHPDVELVPPGKTKNLLVFDFGGGTCDVAVFRLSCPPESGCLSVATLAVSRYHRLGGGDIDQAIFYDVLLPQIQEQNNLERHDLDFRDKKEILEPVFVGVAEELKMGICTRLASGQDDDDEAMDFTQTCADEFSCKLFMGNEIKLTNPRLTAMEFAEILKPFLDPDIFILKETEYRQSLSIFAPIRDAIERCGLEENDIDLCLLAGGSCLIPQVVEAMDNYFPNAEMLTFSNADAIQTAIARGAALNAFSLAVSGRPIIQPVCQETIALNTSSGPIDLVPRGAVLAGGYKGSAILAIPADSPYEPVTVRVELIAKDELGSRVLMSDTWDIPEPVKAGERIRLDYRYDENQVLSIRLHHEERGDVDAWERKTEHPLTHMVNPQEVKLRIEETEERLRVGAVQPEQRRGVIVGLADDCATLRHYEKAISRLRDFMRQKNEPDAGLINLIALYYGYMGDDGREERLYGEAITADPSWSTPWFNLALLLRKQKRLEEAKSAIGKAINLTPNTAPYSVLNAQIVQDMGKDFAKNEFLEIARKNFHALDQLSDWELHWYQKAADMLKDQEAIKAARQEKNHRNLGLLDVHACMEGALPDFVQQACSG